MKMTGHTIRLEGQRLNSLCMPVHERVASWELVREGEKSRLMYSTCPHRLSADASLTLADIFLYLSTQICVQNQTLTFRAHHLTHWTIKPYIYVIAYSYVVFYMHNVLLFYFCFANNIYSSLDIHLLWVRLCSWVCTFFLHSSHTVLPETVIKAFYTFDYINIYRTWLNTWGRCRPV